MWLPSGLKAQKVLWLTECDEMTGSQVERKMPCFTLKRHFAISLYDWFSITMVLRLLDLHNTIPVLKLSQIYPSGGASQVCLFNQWKDPGEITLGSHPTNGTQVHSNLSPTQSHPKLGI
jgi:hypothetical protein